MKDTARLTHTISPPTNIDGFRLAGWGSLPIAAVNTLANHLHSVNIQYESAGTGFDKFAEFVFLDDSLGTVATAINMIRRNTTDISINIETSVGVVVNRLTLKTARVMGIEYQLNYSATGFAYHAILVQADDITRTID